MKILFHVAIFPLMLIVSLQCDSDFKAFKKYIAKSYRIPEHIKEDCNWHYAIILIKTDKENNIKALSVLNEVPVVMKNSFSSIKKYKFSKCENMNEKTILFTISLDNHKENCMVPNSRSYSPSEVLRNVLFYYDDQLKRNPKTVIIQEPIILPVYDSIN